MKLAKQLLSALLAMLLAFGLFLPAHAEEAEAAAQEVIAQEAPVITIVTQPKKRVKTKTNKEITLSVEAKIPEGVNGTLSYQWYRLDEDGTAVELAGETSPVLRLHLTSDDLKKVKMFQSVDELAGGANQLYYHVTVTCGYTEDGQEKSVSAESSKAEVYVYPSLAEYYSLLWRASTFLFRVQPQDDFEKLLKRTLAIVLLVVMPFTILFSPFIYLKIWLK